MPRPEHLDPQPLPVNVWFARHGASAAALALGVVAFVVAAVAQDVVWGTPDVRISAPMFGATAIAAIVAVARRERAYWLWIGGLALAVSAMVLGWILVLGIVVAAAAALILILHALF